MTDLTDAPDEQLASATAGETWPIFICYRQDDGKEIAQWLSDNLHEMRLSIPGIERDITLDVYFDQTAAAIDDWTRLHQPALERSRAMLFVCTPGARSSFGADDWVHKELGWWLDNRETAPIIIDPHDSDRWSVDDSEFSTALDSGNQLPDDTARIRIDIVSTMSQTTGSFGPADYI